MEAPKEMFLLCKEKGKTMKLAITGVCANFLGVVLIYLNLIERTSASFAMNAALIFLAFWALSVLGLVLMGIGSRKVGGILTIIGAFFFVPIGLIAIIGARSVISSGQDMDERRRLAHGA